MNGNCEASTSLLRFVVSWTDYIVATDAFLIGELRNKLLQPTQKSAEEKVTQD
jgi:hypothetical protein